MSQLEQCWLFNQTPDATKQKLNCDYIFALVASQTLKNGGPVSIVSHSVLNCRILKRQSGSQSGEN